MRIKIKYQNSNRRIYKDVLEEMSDQMYVFEIEIRKCFLNMM
jgi:hypothetical protein